MGVEPTSLAWEARVIAVIRRPLNCIAKNNRIVCARQGECHGWHSTAHVSSLGSCSSTIELHPLGWLTVQSLTENQWGSKSRSLGIQIIPRRPES